MKQYGAEFFGTFWLVLGGCGSAVLAAAFPNVGIGSVPVSVEIMYHTRAERVPGWKVRSATWATIANTPVSEW